MGEVFFKRARHVISENGRVKEAVEALKENDFRFLGELLFLSHESLRDDYEVSCPELDLFYDMARKFSGCLGARLTGAGFGGSGIALVEKKRVDVFRKKLLEEASEKGFVCPKVYEVEVGEGAKSCYLNREEKG
jgi:galactokinase